MRGVQGTEQDELREPCRERCPQVSRKRDGFRGQPLEADGLGIQKGPRVSGQVVFPTRTSCLVSEADRAAHFCGGFPEDDQPLPSPGHSSSGGRAERQGG